MFLSQKQKKWLAAGVILVFTTVLMLLVAWWNPLETLQLNFSNALYYERPTNHPIVIVEIDQNTINAMGNPAKWCRSWYAQAIENIEKYQPASVGLDLDFKLPSQGICQEDLEKLLKEDNDKKLIEYADPNYHPNDVALGKTLAKFKNVVLLAMATADDQLVNDPEKLIHLTQEPTLPIASIFSESIQLGHQIFLGDQTGLIRKGLPVLIWNKKGFVSFAVANVLTYLKAGPISNVIIKENSADINYEDKQLYIPLENYQFNINFTTKTELDPLVQAQSNSVRLVPFLDVYKDKYGTGFDPNYFKNKIVLIGAYYFTSGDKYVAPIDTGNYMYGVMIHAQAIQTLLDQAWLYNMGWLILSLVIFILAAISIAIIFSLNFRWALPIIVIIGFLYVVAFANLAFREWGLISNLVYPPLTLIFTTVISYAYRYITEFRQKNEMVSALSKYVNSGVAQQILEQGEKAAELGGVKREITVMFTDIKGFTTISESLQPQSLIALLNEYFAVMTKIVIQNGGTIDKFEGDAIMAVFGSMGNQPDHALSACQAALQMRTALPILMKKWKNDPPLPGGEPKPEIDFRVGISTGEAIVGNIGADGKLEFTAIGDIVNLGSRLESANKKYQTNLMISEATYEKISKYFEARFMDFIKVKGKEKPIKIFQLLCLRGELSDNLSDLINRYNHGLELYFQRKFVEALENFEEILKKWPRDHLTNLYAGRCELLKRYPPRADWDFVYTMESK